ncbi:hypothetical protein WMF04_36340 [Sorangium sp. So ce260]|uniref:hypothetical protein n=1 Tax=Sorangium sp. So ce260 TaxID=3133291 RepID=UPI003F635927
MKLSIVLGFHLRMLSVLPLMLVTAPGCTLNEPCQQSGQTYWICTALIGEKSTPSCHCDGGTREYTDWVCATDGFSAKNEFEYYVNVKAGSIVFQHKGCRDTGSAFPQAVQPELTIHRICDAAPEDDACVSCAKASCCTEHGACMDDPRCACLVDCLSRGNAISACTLLENCGPADTVSTEAAACLDDACQAQCPSLGALGAALADRATHSSTEDPGIGGTPFAGDVP